MSGVSLTSKDLVGHRQVEDKRQRGAFEGLYHRHLPVRDDHDSSWMRAADIRMTLRLFHPDDTEIIPKWKK